MSDLTLIDAKKFVNEWLWDSRPFGTTQRETSGMPWTTAYMSDAAAMCLAFARRRAFGGNPDGPSEAAMKVAAECFTGNVGDYMPEEELREALTKAYAVDFGAGGAPPPAQEEK